MTSELTPGQALGRYELLLPVAKGGMAQVWAARLCGTRGFQKIVAIKTILAGRMAVKRAEAMLLEEARLAAQVHHPNVVGTLELAEEDGTLYLVMEWVHGEPLRDVQRAASSHGGIPRPLALNIIAQACKGLQAAHEARDSSGNPLNIIHRDVSPQNLMVSYSGTVKLADFGVAKAAQASGDLTRQGELKGKIAYMAPEQFLEQPVGQRSDIFALGVLLYHLTTGRHPFKAHTTAQTVHNICDESPTLPTRLVPDYPAKLEAVVLKSLAKSPEQRWESAQAMLDGLLEAEPQTLAVGYENRIADYLSQVMGDAAARRLEALAAAQSAVDRMHLGEPLSSRSLRGLAADLATATAAGRGDTEALQVEPAEEAAPVASDELPEWETTATSGRVSNPRRGPRWAVIAALSFVGAALGSVYVFDSNHSATAVDLGAPVADVGQTAAMPVKIADAPAASQAPSKVAVTGEERKPEASRKSALVSDLAPASNAEQDVDAAVPARHRSAKRKSNVSDRASPSSSTPSAEKQRTPASGATGSRKSVDAWNSELYGGRN